ncbi:MAG TPA: ATP-binding protein [Longimicrobiales bacterium]
MPAPLRIGLLYAGFGLAWILIGDLLLWSRGGVSSTAFLLELGKGAVFVLVSALLLYVLVGREFARRRHAAAQLERVLDTAPVGIVAIAADGTIVRWNAAATRILGWTEADTVGRRPDDLGLDLSTSEDGGTHDAALAGRDGTPIDVRVFTSREGAAGDGTRVVAFRDRRPQMEMEAALRRAHKLEAVGRLAGGIAHEFNNILTAVLGHALLLAGHFDEGDERRQHADEVRRSAERAAALTRQLLVFSGKHISTTATLDLSAVLRELRGVTMRVAGEDVRIEYDLAADLWAIRCDPAQIHQLVLNLIVNAREAISAPGTIALQTANVRIEREHGPDPVPAGEYVLLRITDTGTGMSADTLAHLFEPFFTTKEQGTGLGLAAVYGIVQQCDGHIRVRSHAGSGSAFDIYLPRAEETEATTPPRPKPTTTAAALLVVEDDDVVRELTCRVLRRHGHTVLSARNGHEALQLLDDGATVRLVIADVVMPGMNGIELGRHIRCRFPDLPILFTSGFVGGAAGEDGSIAPGPNFLEKPYRPDELVARVDQLLVEAGAD